MKKILVTGASGYIGSKLCEYFSRLNIAHIGLYRNTNKVPKNTITKYFIVNDIADTNIKWSNYFSDVDCVIHCAGEAHSNQNRSTLNKLYKSSNIEGTKLIANHAAIAGVKRFIFLSSISIYGEASYSEVTLTQSSIPNPKNDYAKSKLEAEKILFEISKRTGLEVVCARLPLVFGPNSPGNINRLLKIVSYGIPLPLGLINNQKSFLGIDNLCDFLFECIKNPNIKNKSLLICDNENLSISNILRIIASASKKKILLFPFPIIFLKFLAFIFFKDREVKQLIGTLKIDSSYTKKLLNWNPRVSTQEGLWKTFK